MQRQIDLVFLTESFNDLKQIKELSAKLGNNSVILAKNFSSEKELLEWKEKAKNLSGEKFKFAFCHLISKPDSKELGKINSAEFFAVFGGTIQSNKFAVSSKKIDFLLSPCGNEKLSFDTGIAQDAKDKGTIIGICFSQFLEANSFSRTILMKNYSFTSKILQKYALPCSVFSGAKSLNQLRSAEDLVSMLAFFGFKGEKIAEARKKFFEKISKKAF